MSVERQDSPERIEVHDPILSYNFAFVNLSRVKKAGFLGPAIQQLSGERDYLTDFTLADTIRLGNAFSVVSRTSSGVNF